MDSTGVQKSDLSRHRREGGTCRAPDFIGTGSARRYKTQMRHYLDFANQLIFRQLA